MFIFAGSMRLYRYNWSLSYNSNIKRGTEEELFALLSRSGVRMFPWPSAKGYLSAPVRLQVQNQGWLHGSFRVVWPQQSAVPVAVFVPCIAGRRYRYYNGARNIPLNAVQLRLVLKSKCIECAYQLRSCCRQ